ncbi:amino acid aminotransferase [Mycolicibacterium vinylchloridicum]|uniref:amino acid aminotransferase n=1 Tax=Mycolicibacterium vinylchloridicum TaxID=2736928 RepID=UPI0015C8ADA9|nr:amino acid aminotransferase [Mycolicibacterium vinylchloridicum]
MIKYPVDSTHYPCCNAIGRHAPDCQPADPAAAALELIVQVPCMLTAPDDVSRVRKAWQDFAGVLDLEGAFSGMTWHDAKHAATAVAFVGANYDEPDVELRRRAALVRDGRDGMAWDDPVAMSQALAIVAKVLGL